MKIGKVLEYIEIFFIVSIIATPIVFFASPLSIEFKVTKVDLREGDIIQLTINEYSFDYNLSYLENYTVTSGIYLNPVFDYNEAET